MAQVAKFFRARITTDPRPGERRRPVWFMRVVAADMTEAYDKVAARIRPCDVISGIADTSEDNAPERPALWRVLRAHELATGVI